VFNQEPTTAERIVFSAMKLFAEKGYGSTSVADILGAAGANSGSLYHAFPTKQHVLLAVLECYRTGIGPMLLAPAWEGVADPIERIFALLASYRRALISTDCFYGCPIGSLALEIHEPDPEVRALLAANFEGWTTAIEACLAQASLARGVDRKALARFVLTVMEGGVMQARTHRDIEAFDQSVRVLRDYFARLKVTSKPKKRGSKR
jgi:TetR/AcrR family transcriptional regulator, transcriptional repressor for nem operon